MATQHVAVAFDVECQGTPRYRVWVNQELFTERQWRFSADQYLEENVFIQVPGGRYHMRVELVPSDQGQVQAQNFRVISGPAQVDQQGFLEIQNENT